MKFIKKYGIPLFESQSDDFDVFEKEMQETVQEYFTNLIDEGAQWKLLDAGWVEILLEPNNKPLTPFPKKKPGTPSSITTAGRAWRPSESNYFAYYEFDLILPKRYPLELITKAYKRLSEEKNYYVWDYKASGTQEISGGKFELIEQTTISFYILDYRMHTSADD